MKTFLRMTVLIIVAGVAIGVWSIVAKGLRERSTPPTDPCYEERRIAYDDGYTMGYSNCAAAWAQRHPEDFRRDRP